ncbi:MAG: energy-coupling factor ABC transporter ATP-binding protein [bacterium]
MKITFHQVHFAYEHFGEAAPGEKEFQLRGLSFEIGGAEFVAIAGRSGSGKTTLLQMFNGLLRPQRGEILVDDQNIHAPGYDVTALRRRLGLAFQFPEAQLFAATVREDIAFAPQQQKLPSGEIAARTRQALQEVGLTEIFLDRDPFTLSEGEKRRTALAGILAMQPEMLILDEPTAGLDARGVAEIKALLRLWSQRGRGLIMISHDTDLIAALAQRVLVLHEGAILFDGKPSELWPLSPHPSTLTVAHTGVIAQAGLAEPRSVRLARKLEKLGLSPSELEQLLARD